MYFITQRHCGCKLAPSNDILVTSMVSKHTLNKLSCDVNEGIQSPENLAGVLFWRSGKPTLME